jgi:hypothetical protein
MMPPSETTPWVWVIEHLSALGWPVIVYCAWQVSKYVDRVTKQATRTVDQVDKMATNCFPTMQASLQNQDVLLHSMDKNLATIAENSRRRREDF